MFKTYIRGSENAFYVSYIHSSTLYVVPTERAQNDKSNYTKYLQSPKIDLYLRGIRNVVLRFYLKQD